MSNSSPSFLKQRYLNERNDFPCRPDCGACCIALSISSPIPGMPNGKPAGVRCAQLTDDNLCRLFGQPDRPAVCINLRPDAEMCGETREEALLYLERLEFLTRPIPYAIIALL